MVILVSFQRAAMGIKVAATPGLSFRLSNTTPIDLNEPGVDSKQIQLIFECIARNNVQIWALGNRMNSPDMHFRFLA